MAVLRVKSMSFISHVYYSGFDGDRVKCMAIFMTLVSGSGMSMSVKGVGASALCFLSDIFLILFDYLFVDILVWRGGGAVGNFKY